MNVQTIMLDLDGTTLTPDNQVTPELNGYLKELSADGKHVFVVTGRSEVDALNALPDDFPAAGMVAANGMTVFAGKTKIFQSVLPKALVAHMLYCSERQKLYYQLHPVDGRRTILNRDKHYIMNEINGAKPENVSINEWKSRRQAVLEDMVWKEILTDEELAQIAKMYFFSEDVARMDAWKNVLRQLQDKFTFDYFSSSHNNVELVGKNISKASGIRILLDHYHLSPDNALAVGDGENDLPMFQLAGYSAAMKNAPEHVKIQADRVTDASYAENGLYKFLYHTFH
ncbi:Cof-type HAD-IIB family hydrolase [Sporolactobacillus shoreicorticis]|uniref:HAD family hydrolase n=1 Tax=Sporolactobacillus shoreicorticis TaxID=1923877 RepID=A0ABW5S4F9_9BACL|nr:HAD family hydrolase [Sporolactobacillus shoreicorticis]MCO7128133.1 Cof-type HAD-IIB family hydrolase [Sporolactobacillus shoreicorticis]